jgi:hypothetical protein
MRVGVAERLPNRWGLTAVVLVLLAVFGLQVSRAQAARIHPLLLSEELPGQPGSVAVDQATHHFYVSVAGRVLNFEANGRPDSSTPELTGASPSFEAQGLAVDNSGGSHEGDIYATGSGAIGSSGIVQQFDADGHATPVSISAASVPANGTSQAGGLPPVVNKGTLRLVGLSPPVVGPEGDVYFVDSEADAIDVFDSSGAFVRQIAKGKVNESTSSIAIDSSGHIYVAMKLNARGEGLGEGLFELSSTTGECVQVSCSAIDSSPIRGVAVDETAGLVYTDGGGGPFQGERAEGFFAEYDAETHAALGETRASGLTEPRGLTVQESSGEIIVTLPSPSGGSTRPTFQIYGAVEIVPDVVTRPATAVGIETAVLHAEIGAAGVAGATCKFQYVSAEAFAATGFSGAHETPCEPDGPFAGTVLTSVSAPLEGLTGGTKYVYRLVGENENGSNGSEKQEFTTNGPTISGIYFSEAGLTAVTLHGLVDPRGTSAMYAFQYVTQASFEAGGFSEATELPVGMASIGAGTTAVAVSQRVEGLVPNTAYRFRLVATNAEGETQGPSIPFATFPIKSPGLPDGRHYEQVSPPNKNGTNIQGYLNSVQASLDGNAVTFFASTGIPGGEGSQDFPSYLSRRATDSSGWSTQGLLPAASFGPRAEVVGWPEDLASVYDFASSTSGAGSLLRRTTEGGGFTQIGTTSALTNPFSLAGTSNNGQVALLESENGGVLPGDLPGKQNLYVYDQATGRMVVAGVLNPVAPGQEPAVPQAGAMAGSFGWWESDKHVQPGGSTRSYYTQAQHAISADGSRVFFTAEETGQLYLRENPLAPQSAISGGECTEPGKACTTRISAPESGVADPGSPAAFVGASEDGSVVYFLDSGKLTANATGGTGFDLYRYEVDTGALTDITLDSSDRKGARVEGVLGMSEDGGVVYFAAAGKLAAGASEAPPLETNLYAIEDGVVRFVSRLGTGPGEGGPVEPEETLNWIPSSTNKATVTRTSRVSADGQALLIRSNRQLTDYQSNGYFELYLLRPGSPIKCISCDPTGQSPTGSAGVQSIPKVGFEVVRYTSFTTRNMSADGRRVVFDSPDQLVAADENDVNDVYEWEAPGKGSCSESSDSFQPRSGGCLYLISGGTRGASASYFGDADAEGENIFFFTSQSLVAQDKDELVDVYDARVDGGIAVQEAEPPLQCEAADSCRGVRSSSPLPALPSTSSFVGPGNPKPSVSCSRGKVKRHGKCLTRKKKRNGKKKQGHKKRSRPSSRGQKGRTR